MYKSHFLFVYLLLFYYEPNFFIFKVDNLVIQIDPQDP